MGFFDDLFGPSNKDLEKAYREGREHYEEEGDTFLDSFGDIIKTVVPSSEEEEARDAGRDDARRDSGPCYISTACVESGGLSDNCLELRVLRNFRDSYVIGLPDGKIIVKDYYSKAPPIVDMINLRADSKQVYSDIFERLVKRSVDLIRVGKNEAAFRNYRDLVKELENKYL